MYRHMNVRFEDHLRRMRLELDLVARGVPPPEAERRIKLQENRDGEEERPV